jgi:hypothetical protein
VRWSANVVYGELTVKQSGSAPVLSPASDLTHTFHPSKAVPGADERSRLLDRVLASSQFRSSQRLREVLVYIVDCALKETPEAATEQQIGVHVFGRTPGYNSSEDSIVRTHARLLRQKLAEYFTTEGSAEPVILEVPKGHYFPIFRSREAVEPAPTRIPAIVPPLPRDPTPQVPHEVTPADAVPARSRWASMRFGFALGTLLVGGLGVFGVLLAGALHKSAVAVSSLDTFWAPFFASEPLVIYSNTLFVGDSKTGLRYAPSGAGSQSGPLIDHYTGIGEVAAVYELTRLFDAHHANFVLKRSLLVTWDEAKLRNLVFIGSRAENPSLNALPSLADFTMVANPGSAGFVNNHPRPGEQARYERPEHPLNKDYAVIALIPGVESGKRTLMLSGLTTMGTQGAVEYVSHKDTLADLMKHIASPGGEVRPFEALLEVPIQGGVPLQGKLIAIRVH